MLSDIMASSLNILFLVCLSATFTLLRTFDLFISRLVTLDLDTVTQDDLSCKIIVFLKDVLRRICDTFVDWIK